MIDYQANFMQKMRFFRKQAGLSQAKLAEICEVSNGTIGNIECGITKPSFELIIKIDEALKITPPDLFYTEKDNDTQKDLLTINQYEIVKETLNSVMTEAFSNAMKNLQKYKIEH